MTNWNTGPEKAEGVSPRNSPGRKPVLPKNTRQSHRPGLPLVEVVVDFDKINELMAPETCGGA